MVRRSLCISLVMVVGLMFADIGISSTVWVNPANTGTEDGLTKVTGYNTIKKAISAMSSGDIVIIADGDWTSYPDMHIDGVPGGSSDNYTEVHAETDWEVRLPYIAGGYSYVEVRGIVFDSRAIPGRSHIVYGCNHTKFIRCGFVAGKITGNIHTCGFGSGDSSRSNNQYNLMEECIAWGGGRYVFYCKYGKYNIFRRCVARHDNQEGTGAKDDGQIANFRPYACDYTILQNCISLDSDRIQYYNNGVLNMEASGFWVGESNAGAETGNELHGCISIKDLNMPYYLDSADWPSANCNGTIRNCIALAPVHVNGSLSLNGFVLGGFVNVNVENSLGMNLLQVNPTRNGYVCKRPGYIFSIRNSIVKNTITGEYGTTNSYMNHYNAGSGNWGPGSTDYDPEGNGLLYPVRTESGSPLATAGSDSGPIGPTVLKKIGVSGTLYGEPGWDEITDENLWPFPNEDKIKELMSDTVEGVSGIYGFTSGTSLDGSPQTLTKYIWEYLGNQIPPEVYDDSIEPSAILDLAAATGISPGTVDLSWTATGDDGNSETAASYIIRYSVSEITPANWESAIDVSGEPSPQQAGSSETFTVTGLLPGQTYYFAIKALDEAGNISDISNSPDAMAGTELLGQPGVPIHID